MDRLETRLAGLPLILAGPILRRVTESSVTVWVALKTPARVTLQIRSGDPGGAALGAPAQAATIAVGRALHMLAITAPVTLTQGVVYTYAMSFDPFDPLGGALPPVSLRDAVKPTAIANPISYPPYDLPSFSLPPKDLNDLRIIHGSCRMPHGTGPDALSIVDELIRVTVADAGKRPHQLFMTGDQIYADDVAGVLLLQLMDASNTLLGIDTKTPGGWGGEETLPAGLPVGGPDYHTHKPSDLPPLSRTKILGADGAGFTSADLRSHLMSFGEYLCMYLFTWSDVLWPKPDDLPTSLDLLAALKAASRSASTKDIKAVPGDATDVQTHMKTLFRVRRALANIPTYMIFDDHDVTDDWNMSPEFCHGVYHPDNPLGRRIVQNALVAYALCQLWGNTPEQFGSDDSHTPAAGRQILSLLDNKTRLDYDSNSARLQTLVGVHSADLMKRRNPEGNYHDQSTWLTVGGERVSADSLTYNFVYTGPAHQVVVTDTRSWRAYPNGSDATPDLLPPDQIAAQIPLLPDLGDRALMVIVTTNAPPVQPIRGATRHDTVSTFASARFSHDAHPDLFESWEIPSLGFDRLLKRITDKFKTDAAGIRHGQAILMSGDVHHSFATRLVYKANNRYGDTSPQKAQAVVAQLVASSFKKQNGDTIGFQREGYFYVPHFPAGAFVKDDMSEGYVGWNVPPSAAPYSVGTRTLVAESVFQNFTGTDNIRKITTGDPTLQIFPTDNIKFPGGSIEAFLDLTRAPDYRYRLDYMLPNASSSQPTNPTPIPAPPASGATPDQRKAAMAAFNTATGDYRLHNQTAGHANLIGRNNISEVTFEWGARDSQGDHKKVNHTIRWRSQGFAPKNATPDPDLPQTFVMFTNYTVDLDPNNPSFKDYAARTEKP
ncbi:hypothetical protein [Phenylobacterium sp.]|uniref:hypothetical protein n=1 Tax=Phenylobacterium sp. TaxID=1871053 RepID=UPI0025FF5ACA|nr:hypothetical protein [Phenylobacterium sp.]